ncbi:MAG: phytanoyl-CoA dioxygenase family protein, partial [Gammaproteobacteria bacterium]|nr:phytanoyl-CoA dioxygenase family protein [Gammaproteobacteria bacterium]
MPDFLNPSELAMIRAACDACVAATEADMRARGVTEDRINVLGKKYFVLSPRKSHPVLRAVIFSEKIAGVCRATIGDTAYLHNEQFVVKMPEG